MKTVLLTNGQQRKTLAIARSLGKAGVKAIVSEETKLNPSGFSKYCEKSLKCPKIIDGGEAYFNWLKNIIEKYHCDIFMPTDDDTMDVAIKYRDELDKICKMYLPPTEGYIIARDKQRTMEFVENCGIAIPKTYSVKDLNELENLSNSIEFPVVIKPKNSSGSRGIRIVEGDNFIKVYLEIHEKYPYPIVQEYIGTGDRYDVCLLYDKNTQLKASFVQKEIRHFPLKHGPSTMQESIRNEELIEISDTIMKKLNWTGIAELEFMIDDRDGKFKFMEINPRFWASLQLAINAGIDFPRILFELIEDKKVESKFQYHENIRCSWILPGEILYFLTSKNRFRMKPRLFAGKKQGVYDDTIMKGDLKPVLGFTLACFRYLFDVKMWRFFFNR